MRSLFYGGGSIRRIAPNLYDFFSKIGLVDIHILPHAAVAHRAINGRHDKDNNQIIIESAHSPQFIGY